MGEVEAKAGRGTRSDLRHDWYTVSLLTDRLVFSLKYGEKVLLGEVAEAAEEIVTDEEKEKALKTRYLTLYTKFFRSYRTHILKYGV